MARRVFYKNGDKMTKKMMVYLADDTLDFLRTLADDDEENIGISTAVNLAVQLCAITAQQKTSLTHCELLYCCDVLNGGAHLTEFTPPDQANILNSFDSMLFSLREGIHEPGMMEKWGIDETIVDKLGAMNIAQMFALAFATRMFWSKERYRDYTRPGEKGAGYEDWSKQFLQK
jgi:hypothetical protein